jgi:Tol biopolymer transport system component
VLIRERFGEQLMKQPRAVVCALIVASALVLTGTPAQATIPGENGKIVFVGNQSGTWQLYTIDPDGSDITQITNLPPTAWELWDPVFSPDGRRILFSHDTPEHPCQTDMFPPAGCIDLYLINADGTGLIRLTNDGLSWNGTWSPDGNRVVFSLVSVPTHENVVATMRADGIGERTRLTTVFWDSTGVIYTPDGTHIVFYSQNGGFVATTWIMKIDGAKQKLLTPPSLEGFPGDVSPDGKHILLADHVNTSFPTALYTMNLDGTGLRQLTRPPAGSSDALGQGGYSPDGKKIVFQSNRFSSDQSLDLFTMDADGSNIKRIASGLTVGGCPDRNCVDASWGPKPKQ